jgi:hypothetical protein
MIYNGITLYDVILVLAVYLLLLGAFSLKLLLDVWNQLWSTITKRKNK